MPADRVFILVLVGTLITGSLSGCRCGQQVAYQHVTSADGSNTEPRDVGSSVVEDTAPDSPGDTGIAVAEDAAPAEDAGAAPDQTVRPLIPRPVPVERYTQVVRIDDRAYLVLNDRPRRSWAIGTARLLRREFPVGVEVDVDGGAIPPELASWPGQQVVIHRRSSSGTCTATAGPVLLLRRLVPNYDTQVAWNIAEGPAPTQDQMASTAWEFDIPGISEALPDGRLLVSRLEGLSQACARVNDLAWGRLSSARVPGVFREQRPAKSAHDAALARYRELPEDPRYQGEFANVLYGSTPTDFLGVPGHTPQIRLWRRDGSSRSYITVVVRGEDGPCGDSVGTVWTLFEVTDSGLALRHLALDSFWIDEGIALFDLDEDGQPEIWRSPGRLFVPTNEGYRLSETVEWPDFDASC